MEKLPGLYVVIPALNEANTIARHLRECVVISDYVLVVDDGSKDATADIARSCGASVLSHSIPEGYDSSISDGINRAFDLGATAVVTCDADGEHKIQDIFAIAKAVIDKTADFSSGVRDHYNRPIEGIVGKVSMPLWGTPDPFCGLKCYSRAIFTQLGPFPKELHIGTLPFVWVKKYKFRKVFIPISINKREDLPRFGWGFKANSKLFWAFVRSLKNEVSGTKGANFLSKTLARKR